MTRRVRIKLQRERLKFSMENSVLRTVIFVSEISTEHNFYCISRVLQAGNKGWDKRDCKDVFVQVKCLVLSDQLKIALCLRRVKNALVDWRVSEILEK